MRVVLGINAAGDFRVRLLRDRQAPREYAPPGGDLLVCSSQFQEMTTESRRHASPGFGRISTRTKLTRNARLRIREAGAILDGGKRDRCVFLTGTLPGGSEAALAALAAWSGWVVQSVKQWIRDYAPGADSFGVWEYQKRGALHLHLCVRAESAAQATDLRRRWKARWIRLLDGVVRRSGVDVYERADGGTWRAEKWVTRTDAQVVEKSVGNYLAKYLSKGSAKTRRRCEYPPSAWTFVSRALRTEIAELRREYQVERLSLSTGIDLWERIAGAVAGQGRVAYGYLGKFDCQLKGLIALLKPVEASMLYEQITPLLACLLGIDRPPNWAAILDITQIAALFGARRISPAPAT